MGRLELEKFKIRNISKHQKSLNNITSSAWEDEDIYGSGLLTVTDNYNTLLDDISHPINHRLYSFDTFYSNRAQGKSLELTKSKIVHGLKRGIL